MLKQTPDIEKCQVLSDSPKLDMNYLSFKIYKPQVKMFVVEYSMYHL